MKVALLGFALPPAEFQAFMQTESGMPVQTQRFGTALATALEQSDLVVSRVSVAPASDFPRNRRVLFRSRRHTDGAGTLELGFVNVLGLKHLTRYLSARRALTRWARRSGPGCVVVHGVNSALLWAALHTATGHAGIRVIPVLTDAPSLVTPYDTWLTRTLKQFDRRLIRSSLRHCDGVIALTESLAQDLAPGKPSLRMEGIATSQSRAGPGRRPAPAIDRVVYCGGLRESYGLGLLLDAVRLSSASWTLAVCGRGPMAAEIEQEAAANPRVQFRGMLTTEEIEDIYAEAALLINPRPIGETMALYSFPSKVLEYLASGRPVMSTALPTLPPDYHDHLILCPDEPGPLAATIDAFFASDPTGRERRAALARQFILTSRGTAAQGQRMADFLRGQARPGLLP